MESDADGDAALGIVDGLVLLSELVQRVFADAAAEHGLPPLQARLLGILRGRRPSMAELAHLIDLDKSSTTGLVDRAQRRGLVRRVAAPEDARSLRVELTDDGMRAAVAFARTVAVRIAELTAHLEGADRQRLAELVGAIVLHGAAADDVDLGPEVMRRARSRPTSAS